MPNIKLAKPVLVNKKYIRDLATEKGCTTEQFLKRLKKCFVVLYYAENYYHAWYPQGYEGHPCFMSKKEAVKRMYPEHHIVMSAYEWVHLVTGLEI